MPWLVQISIALAAAAFAVLVVYVIVTLKTANRSLNQVKDTLVRLEHQVDELGRESTKLVHNANLLTEDVHRKVRSLDPMVQTAAQFGEAAREVTSSVKQVSAALSNTFAPRVTKTVTERNEQASEVMQWISLTLGLVQKWQRLRKARGASVDKQD